MTTGRSMVTLCSTTSDYNLAIVNTMQQSPFPKGVAAPAIRALASVGVTKVEQLTKFTEKEIALLHGMGPKALGILKQTLKEKGLHFKSL